MAKTIRRYELTVVAEKDLGNIYDHTVSEFGKRQAVKYLTGLEEIFLTLIDQPNLGRKRNEIRSGLHSLVYEKHVIFYRFIKDSIRIIRVLRGSRDIPRFLKYDK